MDTIWLILLIVGSAVGVGLIVWAGWSWSDAVNKQFYWAMERRCLQCGSKEFEIRTGCPKCGWCTQEWWDWREE